MKTAIIGILIAAIVYAGYRIYRSASLAKGLREKISKGAILLDVRTEKEYASGHIEGALNISLGTLRERYKELDPEKIYITYCSHGLRSVKAVSLLKERGILQVYNGGARDDLEKIMQH